MKKVYLSVDPVSGFCMCAYSRKKYAQDSFEVRKLGYVVESRVVCNFSL